MFKFLNTNVPCGPDVERLALTLTELLHGPNDGTNPDYGDEFTRVCGQIVPDAPENIAWVIDTSVGAHFNTEALAKLDDACFHHSYPSASGEHMEEVDVLCGRLGTLAIRCTLTVFSRDEDAIVTEFRAVQCVSVDAAMELARWWAMDTIVGYVKESTRIASLMMGEVSGVSQADLRAAVAKAAERLTGASAGKPLTIVKIRERRHGAAK